MENFGTKHGQPEGDNENAVELTDMVLRLKKLRDSLSGNNNLREEERALALRCINSIDSAQSYLSTLKRDTRSPINEDIRNSNIGDMVNFINNAKSELERLKEIDKFLSSDVEEIESLIRSTEYEIKDLLEVTQKN